MDLESQIAKLMQDRQKDQELIRSLSDKLIRQVDMTLEVMGRCTRAESSVRKHERALSTLVWYGVVHEKNLFADAEGELTELIQGKQETPEPSCGPGELTSDQPDQCADQRSRPH